MNTQTMTDKATGADFKPIFGKDAQREDKKSSADLHKEGSIAKMIEQQTAKLPSDTFLWAAMGAMGAAAVCEFTGLKDKSRFFGQWAAPFLLLGVYNKLVKTQGHDQKS